MKLHDKVALVTGAARGIGLAIARRYLDEGARVLLVDRDQAALQAAMAGLPDQARSFCADVAAAPSAAAMVAECERLWGGLDICVCNAGMIRAADFLDLTLDDFKAVMDVNVCGTFLVAQAAARAMVRGGRHGAIVLMSSMTAELAMADQLAYGASKGAVRQMTKSMALSLVARGIRVNAIDPGSIETDIMRTIATDPQALRTVLSRIPMGRLGEPDEVAKVAVFLASDDASYITGQTIYADGGRLALNYTVSVPEA